MFHSISLWFCFLLTGVITDMCTQVHCDHPAEVRWTCAPTTKSGSVVKADDDTHIARGHEKLYYSCYETFGGMQGGPEVSRERAGQGDWLGIFLWLECGGG